MKFKVTQTKLNDCLKNVTPFSDKGHQLEIIKNILLKVNGGFLEISATNLDTSIIEKVPGSSSKNGSITVPANLFKHYVQNLPSNETIDLSLTEKKLTINCKTTKAVINGLDPSNYPTFPTNKKKTAILSIKTKHLKNNLSQVVFATHKDITRPILTGVFLNIFDSKVNLVATDGHRLALKTINQKEIINLSKTTKKDELNILIPASAILSLERILSNQPNEKITIYKEPNEKNILFVIGDGEIEITSSLLEGTYPDYRKLIPKDFINEIFVNRSNLIDAAKRASLFSQENSNPINLNWEEKNKLNIKSSISQIGGNEESLDIKIKTNSPKKKPDSSTESDSNIILSAKYLQEVLQVLSHEYIKISLNFNLDPCLIQGCLNKTTADTSYEYILMPRKS